MKTLSHQVAFYFIVIAFSFSSLQSNAALSGTYTIDASQSASATNYLNFSSAVSDMVDGTRSDGGPANGTGVSGPVLFNIAADTYNEQIVIPQITGASSVNTITFDGGNGNAATRILTFYTTINPANYAVLTLYGSEWIRIKNITVTNTSTSSDGWGILIWGTQLGATPVADNNVISNCIVNMPVTLGIGANLYGIALTGSQTTINTPGKFTNCSIDSCTINNGYSGITAYGWSNNTGNVFSHNTVTNAYARGIEVIGTTSAFPIKILNNRVESNSTYLSNRGIYVINCAPSLTDFIEISGNIVPSFNQVGIALSTSIANDSIHNRIYNNFIGGNLNPATTPNNARGLSVSSDYTDVWFNSIDFNVPTTDYTLSAFTCASGAHYDVRNNIFSYSATSGSGVPFYYVAGGPDTSNLTQFDHNVFYNAGSTDIAYIDGAMYSSASLIGANGFNVSSVITNPNFDHYGTTGYLHLSAPLPYATPIAEVSTDIDGEARNVTTPDVGADEAFDCAVSLAFVTTDASCFGCTDGSVDMTVTGAIAPYTVSWSGGLTTEDIANLAAGEYTVCVNDVNGCFACDTITVSQPTGITEAIGNALVDVFPNPSSGAFTISVHNAQNGLVELMNVTGQLIHAEQFKGNYKRTFEMESGSGLIFIRVSSDEGVYNGKLIFTR